ncbi:MAG: RluA family pseudouridine synthase [bacterium]|nr:RluA family pseudouridine synthase [bacterium]
MTTTTKSFSPTTKTRLDHFLVKKLKISRSQVQKMINDGAVLINKILPKKTGEQITPNDKITMVKPASSAGRKAKKPASDLVVADSRFHGNDKNDRGNNKVAKALKIIATTPDYIVVEKPTGMLTHPTMKKETNALSSILAKKFTGIKKVGDDPIRPGIVHRLDKEASGLLVVARTPKMFEHLKDQFKNRTVDKEYLVLVHDPMERNWGEINFPMARSRSADRMSARPQLGELGEKEKEAKTEFTVEKNFVNFSLIRVKLYTGRMHQIRAHMLAYNHPVVGDPIYFQAKRKNMWDKKLGRLFLHCTKLGFTDLSGEMKTFESSLPKDLADFLTLLK